MVGELLMGASALAILISFSYGVWESYKVRLVRHEVRHSKLSPAHNELRVAHLSDLHMTRWGNRERKALHLVQTFCPHLIALTGDLVGHERGIPALEGFLGELARIAPIFAVAGNVEVRHGFTKAFSEMVRRLGGTWLCNDAVPFTEDIWVAGTDDPHRGRADAEKALAPVPEGAFCVLLAHSPEIILQPPALRADLILCGHTHGGQVRFPFLGALYTHTRFIPRSLSWGCHPFPGGTTLITTSGVGVTRLPIRFLCPPEVSGVVVKQ